ncbi:MAG: nucleotidyltransferase domain-containing protein [Bacillota bacterium]
MLYGSRARGDAAEDSDFDLLILGNGPVHWKTERMISDRLFNLELETGKPLSIQFLPGRYLACMNCYFTRIMVHLTF